MIDEAGRSDTVNVEVDGGIGPSTIAGAVTAGANVLIAGSALFKDPLGLEHAVTDLRARAEAARQRDAAVTPPPYHRHRDVDRGSRAPRRGARRTGPLDRGREGERSTRSRSPSWCRPTRAASWPGVRSAGASGIVGVDMVTLNRLAELIAGPGLAASGRSPMSSSLVDLAVARALDTQPGSFRSVAGHPTTDRRTPAAARRAARRRARCGRPAGDHVVARPGGAARSAARSRRCSRPTGTTRPTSSARRPDSSPPERSRRCRPSCCISPTTSPASPCEFVDALAARVAVTIVCTTVGDELDDDARDLFRTLGVDAPPPRRDATPDPHRRAGCGSCRRPTPTTRYATRPERCSTPHGPAWRSNASPSSGRRSGRTPASSSITSPRRGSRGTDDPARRSPNASLPDWCSTCSTSTAAVCDATASSRSSPTSHPPTPTVVSGRPRRGSAASRQAGVARDDDWNVRLGPLVGSERWGESADSLLTFVTDLRSSLGHPSSAAAVERMVAMVRRPARRLGRSYPPRTSAGDRVPGVGGAHRRARPAATPRSDRRAGHPPPVPSRARERTRRRARSRRSGRRRRHRRVARRGGRARHRRRRSCSARPKARCHPARSSDPLLSDADRAAAGLALSDARRAGGCTAPSLRSTTRRRSRSPSREATCDRPHTSSDRAGSIISRGAPTTSRCRRTPPVSPSPSSPPTTRNTDCAAATPTSAPAATRRRRRRVRRPIGAAAGARTHRRPGRATNSPCTTAICRRSRCRASTA